MANEFALGTTKKNLQKRLDDLKKFLKVATEGGSIDFARVTFGKSLFVFMKVVPEFLQKKSLALSLTTF